MPLSTYIENKKIEYLKKYEKAKEYLANGYSRAHACQKAGISQKTYYRYHVDEHDEQEILARPTFVEMYDTAIAICNLLQGYPNDVQEEILNACKKWDLTGE